MAGLLNFVAGNLLRATGNLPLALIGTLVLGFALPSAFLAVLNIAQRETPGELQGRVSAWLVTRPRPVSGGGVFCESRFTARGALRWPRRR